MSTAILESSKASYLGVGLYTYPEAARIIGVSPATLRRWARDYYYTSRDRRYRHDPVIQRVFPEEPILTFVELVELVFVRLFRTEGVSMRVIRRAAERASELFDTKYPFAVKRLDTDGQRVFATISIDDEDPPLRVEDVSRGQYAFETVVRPFFRKLDYADDAGVLMLWPRERQGRIVIDPARVFGKPIDAETGVPTDVLAEAVNAGEGQSVEQVADWFGIPVDAVVAAVAYEQSPSVV